MAPACEVPRPSSASQSGSPVGRQEGASGEEERIPSWRNGSTFRSERSSVAERESAPMSAKRRSRSRSRCGTRPRRAAASGSGGLIT